MLPNLAHSSAPTLRAYCRQLYRTLETQVMDFLIRARWYELDATRVGLSVSAAEVQRSYEHEKARRFTTPRAFDAFLKQSGETVQDLLFRVRINQIATTLARRGHKSPQAISRQLEASFKPQTRCASGFRSSDCANQPAPAIG